MVAFDVLKNAREQNLSSLWPAVLALIGTLLGATITATVGLYSARAARRHEAEIELRRFRRDEFKRRRGRQEELYTRFIQAGHDVEMTLTAYEDEARASPSPEMVRDQIEDFEKLAQEVRLFASSAASRRIDDLVDSWRGWLHQSDDAGRTRAQGEIARRYDLFIETARSELTTESSDSA